MFGGGGELRDLWSFEEKGTKKEMVLGVSYVLSKRE
jgi:hypothetical protein